MTIGMDSQYPRCMVLVGGLGNRGGKSLIGFRCDVGGIVCLCWLDFSRIHRDCLSCFALFLVLGMGPQRAFVFFRVIHGADNRLVSHPSSQCPQVVKIPSTSPSSPSKQNAMKVLPSLLPISGFSGC